MPDSTVPLEHIYGPGWRSLSIGREKGGNSRGSSWRASNPEFERSLADAPITALVAAVGDREAFCGCVLSPRPYVKAVLV